MSKEKNTVHSLSPEELGRKAFELEEQLFKLRLQKTTGQLGNTATLKFTRKELTRVKTIQTQKQRAQTLDKGKVRSNG